MTKEGNFYYVFPKARFDTIKVGFLGNRVQFHLHSKLLLNDDWHDADFQGVSHFFFVYEVDQRFEVIKHFEDELFKGVLVAPKTLVDSKHASGFVMQ